VVFKGVIALLIAERDGLDRAIEALEVLHGASEQLDRAWRLALGGEAKADNAGKRKRSTGVVEADMGPLAESSEIGALSENERELIVRALNRAGGNKSEAARILRIGRDALRYKLRKHNVERHRDGHSV
jgi:DNA-binding NtrC family response regulator